jgi:hypothetical protein
MRLSLALAGTFFGGLLLGFLLFSEPQRAPSIAGIETPPGGMGQDGPVAQVQSAPSEESPPGAPPVPGTRFDPDRLRKVAPGNGVIEGRIRTREFLPLEGATVSARYRPQPQMGSAPLTTVSGAEGRYRLEGLGAAPLFIEAKAAGYRIEAVDQRAAETAAPGAIIDFIADSLVPIPINVIGSDGSPLAEARIAWTDLRERLHRSVDVSWRREEGVIELPAGRHELRAFHPTDSNLASQLARAWVVAGIPPEPLVLKLESRLGLRGRVLVSEGEQPEEVSVHLLRWDGDDTPTRKRMVASSHRQEAKRSKGFSFAFDDLEAGRYWLAATRFPGRTEVEEFVELAVGSVSHDLALPPLIREEIVVVHVFGPHGETLTEVRFAAMCRGESFSSSRGARPVLLGDGSFAVLLDLVGSPCDAPGTKHFLEVEAWLFGKRHVEFDTPSRETVVVRFDELAWLTVRLEGEERAADRGLVSMFLQNIEPSQPVGRDAEARPGGWFEFAPVKPGQYQIVFMLRTSTSWSGGGGMGFQKHPVQLGAGENQLSIPRPKLFDLTVIVRDAREATRIHLRGREKGKPGWTGIQMNNHPAQADGSFFFEAIPAGSYTLLADDPVEGEMEIEVAGDTRLAFDPRPYTVLRVSIADPQGSLARQGFLQNDIIVALDGKELSPGRETLRRMLRSLEGREQLVVCDVVRGGDTLRMEVDAHVLTSRDGGWVSPGIR